MSDDHAMAPTLTDEHLTADAARAPSGTEPAPPTLPTALLEADVIATTDGHPWSLAAAPHLPDAMLSTSEARAFSTSGAPVPDLPDDALTVAAPPIELATSTSQTHFPDLPESALTTTAGAHLTRSSDPPSAPAIVAHMSTGQVAPDLPAAASPTVGGDETSAPDLPPELLEGAPEVASNPDVAVPPFDVDERIFDDQWDALAPRLASDSDLSAAATQADLAMPPDLPSEWLDPLKSDDETDETDTPEGDQSN